MYIKIKYKKMISKYNQIFFSLCLFLLFLCPASSYAFETIDIGNNDRFFELHGEKIKIYKDSSNEYDINKISSPEFDTKFTQNKEKIPNLGYISSAIWVKFKIKKLYK